VSAGSRPLLELAERALAAAGEADSVQARVVRERSLMLRFARSHPTQATSIDDTEVQIAIVRDGHVGLAETNRPDADSLARCARAAGAAAAAAAREAGSGVFPGFPPPAPARTHDGYDEATAALDPAGGGAALAAAFRVAAEARVEAHGTWTAGEVGTAIASTTGARIADAVTDAFMKVICIAPSGRSGYAARTAVSAGAIDAEALAREAAAKALGWVGGGPVAGREPAAGGAAAAEPASLPPGEYPVVLERHAVGELLAWLGLLAFNGLAYAEGRSALSGRLGTRVVSPAINLSDSPRYRETLPRAFDAEGVPKAPLPLIQDGVAHRVVHDVRSAALAGGAAASTGHALLPGGSAYGPLPTNLVLIGGGADDEAELCRPIERGVYVTRLWYLNPVRPKESVVTGVTRDGTFLIEDGEVTRPLADLRFSDSVLDVLGRVQALGRRSELTSDGEFYGRRFASGVVCPPLRSAAMRFTGGATPPGPGGR
jgi:predicted Zn-dependent protease